MTRADTLRILSRSLDGEWRDKGIYQALIKNVLSGAFGFTPKIFYLNASSQPHRIKDKSIIIQKLLNLQSPEILTFSITNDEAAPNVMITYAGKPERGARAALELSVPSDPVEFEKALPSFLEIIDL